MSFPVPHYLDLPRNATKDIYAFFLEQEGKTHFILLLYKVELPDVEG